MSELGELTTPSLRLPLLAGEQAQKHVTVNEALAALDAVVQLSVKSRNQAVPPAAPAEGDRFIVAANPTGAWAEHPGEIAVWRDGAWSFHAPRVGWLAWVEDADALVVFDGTAWTPFGGGGALQNLTLLGLGATADAANPFSAKLNKALWTAKTAAEGGDGDLRYTLNKETVADILSFLLQRGFSGRAEIGLIGDDKLTVKVSADGANWTNGLSIDNATGDVTLADGAFTFEAEGGVVRAPANTFLRGATSIQFFVQGDGASASLVVDRYQTSSAGPAQVFRKARGSLAAPAAVATNDVMGQFSAQAYDGTVFRVGAALQFLVTAASPSATDMEGRAVVTACPPGSAVASEVARLDHANGLSLFGANPVIDGNRHHRLRAYTVAALPAAAPAGQLVMVSNGAIVS